MNKTDSTIRVQLKTLSFLVGMALFLALPLQHLPAQAANEESEQAPEKDPMDTEGLDPKLARILTNYYKKTFTSQENWDALQSIIFKGTLYLPHGEVQFTAHKKKPNYHKVVMRRARRDRFVMGYDGDEAWQLNPADADSGVTAMPEKEARNFIRDATIGGHLLNPLMEGKQIEVGDVIEVNGRNCFELKVTLPDGQRIRSAIDFVEYAERQQITVNQVNGREERNIYSDFRYIDGVRFPFTYTMISDGKEVHRIEMSEIRINAGLIKSMFEPPRESVPAPEPEELKQKRSSDPGAGSPSSLPFGESRFGESVFADPEGK